MRPRAAAAILAVTLAASIAAVLAHHRRLDLRKFSTTADQVADDDESARALNRARMCLAAAELARDTERDALVRERGATTPDVPTTRPPTQAEAVERMLHDPEVGVRRAEAERALRVVQYSALIDRIGLTPEQAAEFDRLIAQRQNQEADIVAASRAQTLRADDPAFAALVRENTTEADRNLRTLLGDDQYADYLDYERSAALRPTASGLAAAATVSGAPLSTAQAEQVVAILAESCSHAPAGQPLHSSQIDWARADLRLQAILTPSQWESIRSSEPPGPMGMGGRFFPRIHAAINQARMNDAANAAASSPPP